MGKDMAKSNRLLKTIVTDFRQRLENYGRDCYFDFRDFPRGVCGDVSILLAHHLSQNGFGRYRYICGEPDIGITHAWLSDGKLIIDITADQFEDFDVPVFIAPNSPWHDELNIVEEYEAKISIYGPELEGKYRSTYQTLVPEADDEWRK